MPTVSVIVPVYKVEQYLHRCIDSILNQTFADFELLLVDDGSPDNCGTICDEYATKDNRVVVIHQENGGLSAARNTAIDWTFANSDSQWISFIDSDDWVHSEYLQRLLNAAQEHNASVSICGFSQTKGEDPKIISESLTSILWNTEEFYVKFSVNATIACAKLYRKECFTNIRYPVGKIHEDEFVTHRILFQYKNIPIVPAPLYAYYVNEEGITKRPWSPARLNIVEAFEAKRKFFKKYHYKQAYLHSVRYLIRVLHISLNQTKDAGMDQEYIRLRRRLASLLIRYRRQYPLNKENMWLYEQTYPKLMLLYWTMIGILNKLTRSKGICRK